MKTKGIGIMCGSVFVIGFVVGLLLVSVPGVSAEGANLVTNGTGILLHNTNATDIFYDAGEIKLCANSDRKKKCISTVVGSDSKGVPKDIFLIGDDMYCFGERFPPDKYVRLYVVEHQETWTIGDSLVDASGMYVRMHTDERGSFHPDLIWEAVSREGTYDVVVDTNQNAKWNRCEPIDTVIVRSTDIPEFSTVAMPVVLILAMYIVFSRKRKKR